MIKETKVKCQQMYYTVTYEMKDGEIYLHKVLKHEKDGTTSDRANQISICYSIYNKLRRMEGIKDAH